MLHIRIEPAHTSFIPTRICRTSPCTADVWCASGATGAMPCLFVRNEELWFCLYNISTRFSLGGEQTIFGEIGIQELPCVNDQLRCALLVTFPFLSWGGLIGCRPRRLFAALWMRVTTCAAWCGPARTRRTFYEIGAPSLSRCDQVSSHKQEQLMRHPLPTLCHQP